MLSLDFYQLSETLQLKAQAFFSNEKIAKACFVVAIILFLWCSYIFVAMFVAHYTWKQPEPFTIAKDIKQSPMDNVVIINKHLFGGIPKTGTSLADANKTSLDIKLKAIIADENSKLGSIIVADKDGIEKSYFVGDKIPTSENKVTLEHIFKDKIYFSSNDVLEYYEYPKLELKTVPENKRVVSPSLSIPVAPVTNSPMQLPNSMDEDTKQRIKQEMKKRGIQNLESMEVQPQTRNRLNKLKLKHLNKVAKYNKKSHKNKL